ncbi:uncharacterized protein LOC118434024 [Folsomia candida]|nr:uncharacterized protein LOC118434024 [Folsomia candida]
MKSNLFRPVWIYCCPLEGARSSFEKTPKIDILLKTSSNRDYYQPRIEVNKEMYPDNTGPVLYKMGMCIQPLYNYEDPIGLAEWIEYHKILGVEHFTFYNLSIGAETSKLLFSYGNQIKIMQWTLPFDPKLIKYYGQVVQINDCIYRYRGIAEFVGLTDVDEFIVPGSKYLNDFTSYHNLFQEIFSAYEILNQKPISAIIVTSRFSFSNFPHNYDVTSSSVLSQKLRILTCTNTASSGNFIYKSKVILRPKLVQEEEVRWPTVVVSGTEQIYLDEEHVHFIHYRPCSQDYLKLYCIKNCSTCDNINYTNDTSIARRFGGMLLQNVKQRLGYL